MELTSIIASIALLVIEFIVLKTLPLKDKILGKDRGKKFVQGSNVNIGKPTGVGVYFITLFAIFSMIFTSHLSIGLIVILAFLLIEMITGYLDDISEQPWGEYIKGALDIIVSVITSVCISYFFGTNALLFSMDITFNVVIYVILAVALLLVSINATNATDGVDGLSSTLSILSVITLMIASYIRGTLDSDGIVLGIFFIISLFVYLLFNHYPSKMLMGDAGSRSIGFFIAFYAMYLKIPFSYLIIGLPFLLDGGISILKITIGRISDKILHKKIIILKNIRTPLHDHLKKEMNFSPLKTMRIISCCGLVIDVIYIIILLLAI